MDLPLPLRRLTEQALGAPLPVPVISARPAPRGYSRAARWIVQLADGRGAFVKQAQDPQGAAWLRTEQRLYQALQAPFLPRVLGWWDEGGDEPVLFLEDLSQAHWPPPWSPALVQQARGALAEVARITPPPFVPRLCESWRRTTGWAEVAADPQPLLALGLCDGAWLRAALPRLLAAADPRLLDGEALLHTDVRSDNLCFAGARTVLVDWNWVSRGAARAELALFAPSLHLEGGPAPDELLPGEPGLAALVSGLLASRAGLPEGLVPKGVRAGQRAQLRVALPWAARALGLPAPG